MKIMKSRFGEDMPYWESSAEQNAACEAYLAGEYDKLTALEVEFLRSCETDPNNIKFDQAHAGVLSEEVEPMDFYGLIFIYDLGSSFEEGKKILLDKVGPRPVTPLTMWEIEKELNHE